MGELLARSGHSDQANAAFQQLINKYPQSLYLGDATVRILDIALMQRFDIEAAKALIDKALAWANARTSEDAAAMNGPTLEPWRLGWRRITPPDEDFVKYNIHLRAGIIAYLQEDYDGAVAALEAAKPEGPDGNNRVRDTSVKNIGLLVMIAAAKRHTPAWDERVEPFIKTDRQRTAIRLADCCIHAGRTDQTIPIYERFAAGEESLQPMTPDLEAYTTWRLGWAYAQSRLNNEKAMSIYRRFYRHPLKDSPWAGNAILALGVLTYNTTQDPKQAMTHYEHVIRHYPDHPEAERAFFFYCLKTIQIKDVELAKKSADEYVRRYADSPNSTWREHVIRDTKQLIAESQAIKKSKKELK